MTKVDLTQPITQVELKAALMRVASEDVGGLLQARLSYGDSCLKRGGVGFMMNLFRKTDRLEMLADKPAQGERFDLFDIIQSDASSDVDGMLDTVRDLRRYLMLAEAHLVARGAELPESRDNKLAWGGDNDICLVETVKRQSLGDISTFTARESIREGQPLQVSASDPTGQENPYGFVAEDELLNLRDDLVNLR